MFILLLFVLNNTMFAAGAPVLPKTEADDPIVLPALAIGAMAPNTDPDIDEDIVDGVPHTELIDIVGGVPHTEVVLVTGAVDAPPKAEPEAEMDPNTEPVVAKLAPVVVSKTDFGEAEVLVDTTEVDPRTVLEDKEMEAAVVTVALNGGAVFMSLSNSVLLEVDLESDETNEEDTEVLVPGKGFTSVLFETKTLDVSGFETATA